MKILILEDNTDRINAFKEVLKCFDKVEIHIWQNAHNMIKDLADKLDGTDIISLDHDLVSENGIDPGDGLDVAKELKNLKPVCPIIIHSTNYDRSWSMLLELQEGGWDAERHPPVGMGEDWIYNYWIATVKEKFKNQNNDSRRQLFRRKARDND